MVRELMKDTVYLAQKAQPATADDVPTADDLLDTLRAHADGCVGMAANMIGVNKAIIVFDDEGTLREMFNPEIVYRKGLYLTEEGCLSLYNLMEHVRQALLTKRTLGGRSRMLFPLEGEIVDPQPFPQWQGRLTVSYTIAQPEEEVDF